MWNKVSREKFTAAFMIQCLAAVRGSDAEIAWR
ncbi:MAG: DUF6471 domain-containing protein [Alphaproteobacteria bacterium]